MKKTFLLLTFLPALAILGGCESNSTKTTSTPPAAQTRPYQGWSTSQLQSKRTQLMIDSTKPAMVVDPVNGGSYNPSGNTHSRQLDAINAELLLRDPSGKLLTP